MPLVGYHPWSLLCYGSPGMTKNHAKDRLRFGAANTRPSEARAEKPRAAQAIASHRLQPDSPRRRARSSGPCLRRLQTIARGSRTEEPIFLFSQNSPQNPQDYPTSPRPGNPNANPNSPICQRDRISGKMGKNLPSFTRRVSRWSSPRFVSARLSFSQLLTETTETRQSLPVFRFRSELWEHVLGH